MGGAAPVHADIVIEILLLVQLGLSRALAGSFISTSKENDARRL